VDLPPPKELWSRTFWVWKGRLVAVHLDLEWNPYDGTVGFTGKPLQRGLYTGLLQWLPDGYERYEVCLKPLPGLGLRLGLDLRKRDSGGPDGSPTATSSLTLVGA
jgi:hypothetical protein